MELTHFPKTNGFGTKSRKKSLFFGTFWSNFIFFDKKRTLA